MKPAISAPLIAIAIATYNAEKDLEAAILSVINQTYQPIELIIIDGGSTDGTVEIIKKYSSKISRWISEPDEGVYDAMNKALDIATADWLYFLGADDLLADNNAVAAMASHFADANTAYYGDVHFKNQNTIYRFKLSKWKLCLRNLCHQSLFYPRSYYKTHSYNLKYKIYADHVYNILMYAYMPSKIKRINQLVAVYNDGAGISAHVFDQPYFNDLPSIVKQHLGVPYALYVKLRVEFFQFKRRLQVK